MTEERLHRTRVCAVLQEMSREAVSQRMWRDVFDAHPFRVTLDHGPRKLAREWPPAMQEHVWRRLLAVTGFHRRVLL